MALAARPTGLAEIVPLREQYRAEMNCQVIHDSIHIRPGWTCEYALDLDGATIGYGSAAIGGPWTGKPTLYEFHVEPAHRTRIFELFVLLIECANPAMIVTQTNARLLPVMLHTFATNIRAEAILFEDAFTTSLSPMGASFRLATREDSDTLQRLDLDPGSSGVVLMNGEIAGAGGVLFHYNPPYGDIYMAVARPWRNRGLGAYLVQELKAACRANGKIAAARCNIDNPASRRTLQKAGFVPCGNIIAGDLPAGKNPAGAGMPAV